MKLYQTMIFGVSIMAVASAYAGGTMSILGYEDSSTTQTPSTKKLVQNILASQETDESGKLKLIAGLFKEATPEIVKTALSKSYPNQKFNYQIFFKELEILRAPIFDAQDNSLFQDLSFDVLNLIFKEANDYQIDQLLRVVDSAHGTTKLWIESSKPNPARSLSISSPPIPKLLASYFKVELEKISKKLPQKDRTSKYKECIELLTSLNIDESIKVRILETRSPNNPEFIEALALLKGIDESFKFRVFVTRSPNNPEFIKTLALLKSIDESLKIRIFATKYITDPKFAQVVQENKFSGKIGEFVKEATPKTVKIDMTGDLDEQLKAYKDSILIVKVDKFDKNKIEKLLKNKNIFELNIRWGKMDNGGANFLAAALNKNSTLISLDLSFSSISYDDKQYLIEALKTNSTLINPNIV